MALISSLLSHVLALFQLEFSLFGFTFSMWQVFLWTTIAGIVARIIGEVFFGD